MKGLAYGKPFLVYFLQRKMGESSLKNGKKTFMEGLNAHSIQNLHTYLAV